MYTHSTLNTQNSSSRLGKTLKAILVLALAVQTTGCTTMGQMSSADRAYAFRQVATYIQHDLAQKQARQDQINANSRIPSRPIQQQFIQQQAYPQYQQTYQQPQVQTQQPIQWCQQNGQGCYPNN